MAPANHDAALLLQFKLPSILAGIYDKESRSRSAVRSSWLFGEVAESGAAILRSIKQSLKVRLETDYEKIKNARNDKAVLEKFLDSTNVLHWLKQHIPTFRGQLKTDIENLYSITIPDRVEIHVRNIAFRFIEKLWPDNRNDGVSDILRRVSIVFYDSLHHRKSTHQRD